MNSYGNRDIYRRGITGGFSISYRNSELLVIGDAPRGVLQSALERTYGDIESYISRRPEFLSSLEPIEDDISAPVAARDMMAAARLASVGPMAAVAGAVSREVGREALKHTDGIFLENGGDIYMMSGCPRRIAIYAGSSPLSMKVGIEVAAGEWGICTSAGRVGHSLSFGRADAAVVIAHDAPLADACATRLGNLMKSPTDIEGALESVYAIEGVLGAVGIIGESMGAIGDITLINVADENSV